MKELVVISGKGGTGKTSLMAAFASLARSHVLCDADVDAADLHLLMTPEIQREEIFTGGVTAKINPDKCTECGLCREMCRWSAIDEDFKVDTIECEGCGVCAYFCPEKAIDLPISVCGKWFVSNSRFGPMVHARLGIAEENSGKLVTLVRQEAKKLAEKDGRNLLITDGPPGVGCPVIASLGGATSALIVSEPTVAGLHDMERVADLTRYFKIPTMLCVNKFDLNPEQAEKIQELGKSKGVTILENIPFDPIFTKAMIQGQTVMEYAPDSKAAMAVKEIWKDVEKRLGTKE